MTFDGYYQGIFGERWAGLRAAMLAPARSVAWWSPWSAERPPEGWVASGLPNCWIPPVEAAPSSGPPCYFLDGASVAAATALDVQPGDAVLDLCAAPGGKTLVLAAALGATGRLNANERSADRRGRLWRVLDTLLPPEVRAHVSVSGHDAERWCLHEKDAWDRILLDAPCSGERHLLADPKALATWTPARSRNLAHRQYAMLASALDVVRVGGRIVYSTCALSPAENEAVVERLLAKRAGRVRVVEGATIPTLAAVGGEVAGVGTRILPDRAGYGPMFVGVVERVG